MAVLRVIAGDELVQVRALQEVGFQREVLVGAQVVDPELVCPPFLGGGFAVASFDRVYFSKNAKALGVRIPRSSGLSSTSSLISPFGIQGRRPMSFVPLMRR